MRAPFAKYLLFPPRLLQYQYKPIRKNKMRNIEALNTARAMHHDGRLTDAEMRDVESFLLDFDLKGPCAAAVKNFLREKE